MAVTLLQLVTAFREEVDDKAGASWQTDDTLNLWSNEEATRYANQAQREYCRLHPIMDVDGGSSTAVRNISVVAGTGKYTLDPRVVVVLRASLGSDTRPLERVVRTWLDREVATWQEASGTPLCYVVENQYLWLYPKPDANSTLYMQVGRLPLADMAWATRATDTLSIPDAHAYELLPYMCHLAYRKQDADVNSEKKSLEYLALFQKKVGTASVDGDWVRKNWAGTRDVVRMRRFV